MLDGVLRRAIDPALRALARRLAATPVPADAVTAAGLALGLLAGLAIMAGALWTGLALILVSRLCDGLDGALARERRATDLGGYLDIVFDYVFYGWIPLAFAVLDPAANALPAAILLAAFYANCASFLAFAIMAEKRGIAAAAQGPAKSFHFSTGLAEASETLLVFALFCLFPGAFAQTATLFALACAWTCASRIRLAIRTFRDASEA